MISILIVGTGALASLFAARLAAAGLDVTMLGTWPDGLEALGRDGLRLVDASGATRTYPVRVTDDPAACAPARWALVLVKSWQTERAAGQLLDCLRPDGIALTLQNGLGNREILANALGEARVALGTTTSGATLLAPGVVRAGGEGAISLEPQPRLASLIRLLEAAGFVVESSADLDSLVWGKLVVNAAINPLTALLQVPNGELLARPDAQNLMGQIADEVAEVAIASSAVLPFEDPVAAAMEVARKTASNHSSMFQDVMRGAKTEIDAICGAVVKAGEELDVPTPINRTLWHLVRSLHLEPEEPPLEAHLTDEPADFENEGDA